MITVEQAEKTILSHTRDYGTESVALGKSHHRILAENLYADRDLPPYDRVAMDGIAIRHAAFARGIRTFAIKATQGAGQLPVDISRDTECIEIMTGAALPATTDTVIRYEEIEMADGRAILGDISCAHGQNVHHQGSDKKQGEMLAAAPQRVTPALVGIAASIGKSTFAVKQLPRIAIISTGDELVEIEQNPTPYQVRRSNSHTIHAALQPWGIDATIIHIPDDLEMTRRQIGECLEQYDVLLLSGGVSMGKYDYIPGVLAELAVQKYFYKVQQRPGKPFWFGGRENGALVFAFPGNPVSAFLCLHRYFVPWLRHSLGVPAPVHYAMLDEEIIFTRSLQYFLQVKLTQSDSAQWVATSAAGNGSGDFSSLAQANAFMELPAQQSTFQRGEMYPVWRY